MCLLQVSLPLSRTIYLYESLYLHKENVECYILIYLQDKIIKAVTMSMSLCYNVVKTILEYCDIKEYDKEGVALANLLNENFNAAIYQNEQITAQKLIQLFFTNYDELSSGTMDPQNTSKARSLIMEGAKRCLRNDRVIILAPGPLEPIEDLSKLFKEVVLTGYNEKELLKYTCGLKNVKVITKDFTGDLYSRIIDCFEKAHKEKIQQKQALLNAAELLLQDSKKIIDHEILALGQTDYIISSNIITQLPTCIVNGIDLLQGHFYKKEINSSKLDKACIDWSLSIYNRHIRNLSCLLGGSGIAYLADTISRGEFFDTTFEIYDDDKTKSAFDRKWKSIKKMAGLYKAANEIDRLFIDCLLPQKWNWDTSRPGTFTSNPRHGYGFVVSARVLMSKLPQDSLMITHTSSNLKRKISIDGEDIKG